MSLFSLLLLVSLFVSVAQAKVPSNATFKLVNEGEFGPYIVEYDGNYRVLGVFNSPFQLCFYNTTPNAYYLALRMAIQRTEPIYRWVWEANRGNPVKENATSPAEPMETLCWPRPMVESLGKPTLPAKVLLASSCSQMSLKAGGVSKLVSRLSAKENVDGPYSLVMEQKALVLYYKSNNSARPMPYFASPQWSIQSGSINSVTFKSAPETEDAFAYELALEYQLADDSSGKVLILARPKYNATSSFIRIGIDGNVKIYTYYDKVSWGGCEVTFTLFDRESNWETECQLPERCGNFGVCKDDQCVSCPSPKGCSAYFYNQQTSRRWIAYELKTLRKVENSTHVGYIKAPNH
ncbi:hypothetical protein FNV43_RR16321 [Rhamnella rubrinervis]|uniref:S-locus glycoprotein domain-containing protein n=1 Tax=Rhamnella rubrinervis TaxID=2594499 RepID=A0A8K0GYK5_9ROSA|nr:hypothetical protein FNV43_RR16321 [Rhamnella rubrinervis]